MRSLVALAVSLGFVLARTEPARAQAPGATEQSESFLSVTRDEGAEGCPDGEALAEHVRRVRGQQATTATVAYHVRFTFKGGVFRASIQVGSAAGARVLRDRGATCASLEQATALTLALLMDSDASELPPEPEDEPPPPVEKPPPKPDPFEPARAEPSPHRAMSVSLAAGGGALLGVLNPVAPTVLGELGIGVGRFRTSIGVLWVPEQTLDLPPGAVDENLLSGVARTCLSPWHNAKLRFDLCSGVYAGLLKVKANGYTRNDAVNKAWLAVPLELALSSVASPIGVELGVSALLPLRRNDFSIDNLGVAYESWPVGMLISMRAVGSWWL